VKRHMPYDRATRLADQIFQVVSQVCYNELSDPRLNGVQITQVRMTKDLRTARIFFHLADSSKEKELKVIQALRRAQGYLKRAVAREIEMKYVPEFDFFYDNTSDVHDRIEEIFAGLGREEKV
jgi:ribosome-binding factor A